jgi:hypothetical protein
MPVINKPNQHFDVLTWTGTGGGSGATRTITGLNFQPDFIWEKARSSGSGHQLLDSVRGVGQNKVLASNSTGDEPEAPNTESLYGWLSAINSDGFTLTNGTSTFDNWNKSADTYVGWTWKAGGAAVANTSGTITSQVSANPTAGFSVVTYTGNGSSSATVGHGLGVAPGMIIVKSRSATTSWLIRHSSLTAGYQLRFTTDAQEQVSSATTDGGLGSGTSSVINFIAGSSNVNNVNASGGTFVAYCFAPIAGYSAFGSYTGNGSTDGPFIYTGFRPRFVMIKASSISSEHWYIVDATRSPYNAAILYLSPDDSDAETSPGAAQFFDFLSNGFKLRVSGSYSNSSGATYIYMAFAENPFKYANAR